MGSLFIYEKLGQINDVVRLCWRLGVPLNTKDAKWPLLTVELNALKDEQIDGVFEVCRDRTTLTLLVTHQN